MIKKAGFMSDYRLFGADTSPYSQKVRSFLNYKKVDFDWIVRARGNEEEFQAAARAPTVPLLISPQRAASQDSTAMLAALEADHPEPSTVPDTGETAILALILEDFADEWLNKCMFQQRWSQMPDRKTAAMRVLVQLNGGKRPRAYKKAVEQIGERMAARLPLVGAEEANGEILAQSLKAFATRLDSHLKHHLFIFGGHPSVADFALAAQFQQILMDETPAAWLTENTPFLVAWCENMADPKTGAPFEPLDALQDTLAPIFAEDVAKTYLPWASANTDASRTDAKRFSVDLETGTFEQSVQTYAARAFKSVTRAVKDGRDNAALTGFLSDTGCAAYFPSLQPSEPVDKADT